MLRLLQDKVSQALRNITSGTLLPDVNPSNGLPLYTFIPVIPEEDFSIPEKDLSIPEKDFSIPEEDLSIPEDLFIPRGDLSIPGENLSTRSFSHTFYQPTGKLS